MEIYAMKGLNGEVNIIDTFQSVIWNMQFFDVSDFELVVPGTADNFALLTKGTLLVRSTDISVDPEDPTKVTYKNVMRIQDRNLTFDIEDGWILTLTGPGLKKIVGQRIVWQQTNLSGTVENAIRQVITENIISPTDQARVIPDFTMAPAKGYTDQIEAQLFSENIADWLVNTCELYGYGWDVYISAGKYVFEIAKGTDRTYDQNIVTPVVFSMEYDNMIAAGYQEIAEETFNAALIGGEGDGTDQITETIGTATGIDRSEGYIDASSVSSNGEIITLKTYKQMLQAYGAAEMVKKQDKQQLSGEINHNGLYKLNEDYFLGDIVQIRSQYYDAKTQIIELIYSEDENGSVTLPTFGAWQEDE
jgi:hypothetical protein